MRAGPGGQRDGGGGRRENCSRRRVKGANINNRLKQIRKYADTDAVSVQHNFPPIGEINRCGSESGCRNTPYKGVRPYQAHVFDGFLFF